MGELNESIAAGTQGKYGFTMAGAVTGATYPEQIQDLRARLPHTFFLVPGYGAQGGTAEDVKYAFNEKGTGPSSTPPGALCAPGKRPAATDTTSRSCEKRRHCHEGGHRPVRDHPVSVLVPANL